MCRESNVGTTHPPKQYVKSSHTSYYRPENVVLKTTKSNQRVDHRLTNTQSRIDLKGEVRPYLLVKTENLYLRHK